MQEIGAAEKRFGIPENLLLAMAKVESGRGGDRTPWPWTANIDGKPVYYDNRTSAEAGIMKANKHTDMIAVGVMQLHYRWQQKYFKNISEMLEPATNIQYSAALLYLNHKRFGSWTKAVASYNSSKPAARQEYVCLVFHSWKEMIRNVDVLTADPQGYCAKG